MTVVCIDIDDECYQMLISVSSRWNVPIEVLVKRWIETKAEIEVMK